MQSPQIGRLNARLRSAIEQGLSSSVAKAISAGAEVNHIDALMTPLQQAGAYRSPPILEILLKAGADPNSFVNSYNSSLVLAASECLTDSVEILLNHRADPNVQRGEALIQSAKHNNLAAVKMLLSAGCEPNSTGIFGHEFPLAEAASGLKIDESLIQTHPVYFRRYLNIQAEAKGKRGAAELQRKGLDALLDEVVSDRLKIIDALLEAKAQVNFQISCRGVLQSGTALHEAIAATNFVETVYLLTKGAELTAVNEDGVTANKLLAENGMKKMLLEYLAKDCAGEPNATAA